MPVAAIAVAWMSLAVVIFAFPTTSGPTGSEMNYMVVVFGGWIALCLGYYYCPVYGGFYWFTGPRSNIETDIMESSAKNDAAAGGEDSEKASL